MPITPGNIHVGAANIYVGTTAPASGAPPTWLTHTNGVPATGTHLGATTGESLFTWKPTYSDIEAEQSIGVIDQFVSKEEASLTFTAQERIYLLLKAAFGNIGSVDDGTRTGFYGGGGGTILNIAYQTVVLTSLRRDIAGRYEVLMAYRTVSVDGMPIRYSRTTPSVYQVTFRCLPDGTRTIGDQIFQFSREK